MLDKVRYYHYNNYMNNTLNNKEGNMRVCFKDLNIGDQFHTGKSYNAGIHSDTLMWQEWKKVSASMAICTGQFGYFNTRQVGYRDGFSANKLVFKL